MLNWQNFQALSNQQVVDNSYLCVVDNTYFQFIVHSTKTNWSMKMVPQLLNSLEQMAKIGTFFPELEVKVPHPVDYWSLALLLLSHNG